MILKIKKILLSLSLNLVPFSVLATGITEDDVNKTKVVRANVSVVTVLVNIVNWVLGFSAALAVLFIVIGGVRYVTSSGNADALEGAKKTLLWAVVGLLIITLSLVIVNMVSGLSDEVVLATLS